eukprot:3170718-Amphidinium_carterae.1
MFPSPNKQNGLIFINDLHRVQIPDTYCCCATWKTSGRCGMREHHNDLFQLVFELHAPAVPSVAALNLRCLQQHMEAIMHFSTCK